MVLHSYFGSYEHVEPLEQVSSCLQANRRVSPQYASPAIRSLRRPAPPYPFDPSPPTCPGVYPPLGPTTAVRQRTLCLALQSSICLIVCSLSAVWLLSAVCYRRSIVMAVHRHPPSPLPLFITLRSIAAAIAASFTALGVSAPAARRAGDVF